MKFLLLFLFPLLVLADTVPATSIKARLYNFDGSIGLAAIGDALKVNLTNSSVAVTGSFYQATQPVSIAGIVAVSGPLTDSQIRATPLNVLGPLTNTELRATPLTVTGSVNTGGLTDTQLRASPISVTGTLGTTGLTDAQLRASPVPMTLSGTQNVSVLSSALPVGASVSSLQSTGNSSLNSIDGKLNALATAALQGTSNTKLDTLIAKDYATQTTLSALNAKVPSLGQATNAGSVPVVLPAAQLATLTPLSSISVNNFPTSTPVTGNFLTDAQIRATPLPVSGSFSFTTSSLPVTQSGDWTTGRTWNLSASNDSTTVSGSVNVLNFPAQIGLTDTQLRASAVPVSVSGVATAANQVTAQSSLTSIDGKLTSPLTVSVNNYPSTQVISGDVSVKASVLPSGASTLTEQQTQTTKLTSIDSKLTAPLSTSRTWALNQSTDSTSAFVTNFPVQTGLTDTQLRASAVPVSLTSTTITNFPTSTPVTGSVSVTNFPATQPISAASLPLPTGAATEATLSSLNGKVTAVNTGAVTISSALPTGTNSIGQVTANAGTNLNTSALALEAGHLASIDSSTASLNGKDFATQTTLALIKAKTDNIDVLLSTRTKPADSQNITGTVTSNIGTTGGLALEAGHLASIDSTGAKDSSLGTINTSVNTLLKPASTLAAVTNVGSVTSITNPVAVTGTFFQATQPISGTIIANAGTNLNTSLLTLESGHAASIDTSTALINTKIPSNLTVTSTRLLVDPSGVTSPVSIASLPLPSGGATSANQTTQISYATSIDSTLSSINSKTPTLVSGRQPVDGSGVTQPVSGSIGRTWNLSSADTTTVVQPTGTNLHTVVDSGTVTANIGTSGSLALEAGHLASIDTSVAAINTKTTDGTQKTKIVDGSNNTITSIDDGNGTKALEVAQGATSFVFSSVNSSTAQLAAGATFTGTIESVTNQQSGSILLTSDQNGTLVFTEYIDAGGTRISRSTTTSIVAGTPYSRSFVINGNYFKAAFTNNGGSTTTTFNLNTAYGTIPSATALGNGQVSLDEVNGTAISLGTKTAALSLPIIQSQNQTYSSTATSLSFAATATDIYTITGSATKTIRVKTVGMSCTQTTSQLRTFNLIKRSTADTGGTSTNLTELAFDSANAAPTATTLSYTANPTLGTTVGTISSMFLNVISPTGGVNLLTTSNFQEFPIFKDGAQEVVLRGTSEVLAVNANSVTSTGNSCNIFAIWTEE